MHKSHPLPADNAGLAELLEHLATRLPPHAARLGLRSEELAALQKDAAAFRFIIDFGGQLGASLRAATAYLEVLQHGGAAATLPFPSLPAWPASPPLPVPPGILPRLQDLIARIQAAPHYTAEIGRELHLAGNAPPQGCDDWQPVIEIRLDDGHPTLCWSKDKAEALEIWVEREAGSGFSFFAISTIPQLTDPSPRPVTGAQWRYKAIYRLDNKPVGQWSEVHSVAVGS